MIVCRSLLWDVRYLLGEYGKHPKHLECRKRDRFRDVRCLLGEYCKHPKHLGCHKKDRFRRTDTNSEENYTLSQHVVLPYDGRLIEIPVPAWEAMKGTTLTMVSFDIQPPCQVGNLTAQSIPSGENGSKCNNICWHRTVALVLRAAGNVPFSSLLLGKICCYCNIEQDNDRHVRQAKVTDGHVIIPLSSCFGCSNNSSWPLRPSVKKRFFASEGHALQPATLVPCMLGP